MSVIRMPKPKTDWLSMAPPRPSGCISCRYWQHSGADKFGNAPCTNLHNAAAYGVGVISASNNWCEHYEREGRRWV